MKGSHCLPLSVLAAGSGEKSLIKNTFISLLRVFSVHSCTVIFCRDLDLDSFDGVEVFRLLN